MRVRLVMSMTTILVASILGPSDAARAQTGSARPASAPIAWQLVGEPSTTITMAQRRSFRLWMVARNTGTTPVDTGRDQIEFVVNGAPSMELGMAFGNGVRTRDWYALAPGQTVREARDMGDTLFPAPGNYVIAMRLAGVEVARLAIRVTR